jgi:hypothetical protein
VAAWSFSQFRQPNRRAAAATATTGCRTTIRKFSSRSYYPRQAKPLYSSSSSSSLAENAICNGRDLSKVMEVAQDAARKAGDMMRYVSRH